MHMMVGRGAMSASLKLWRGFRVYIVQTRFATLSFTAAHGETPSQHPRLVYITFAFLVSLFFYLLGAFLFSSL
jgi:hypothetical protein